GLSRVYRSRTWQRDSSKIWFDQESDYEGVRGSPPAATSVLSVRAARTASIAASGSTDRLARGSWRTLSTLHRLQGGIVDLISVYIRLFANDVGRRMAVTVMQDTHSLKDSFWVRPSK